LEVSWNLIANGWKDTFKSKLPPKCGIMWANTTLHVYSNFLLAHPKLYIGFNCHEFISSPWNNCRLVASAENLVILNNKKQPGIRKGASLLSTQTQA